MEGHEGTNWTHYLAVTPCLYIWVYTLICPTEIWHTRTHQIISAEIHFVILFVMWQRLLVNQIGVTATSIYCLIFQFFAAGKVHSFEKVSTIVELHGYQPHLPANCPEMWVFGIGRSPVFGVSKWWIRDSRLFVTLPETNCWLAPDKCMEDEGFTLSEGPFQGRPVSYRDGNSPGIYLPRDPSDPLMSCRGILRDSIRMHLISSSSDI